MKKCLVMLAMAAGMLVNETAWSALSFVEDFNDASWSTGGMLEATGSGWQSTPDGKVWNNSGSRQYMRTVGTDYLNCDWTMEVEYLQTAAGDYSVTGIGLGEGAPDAGYYDEPANSLYVQTGNISWHPTLGLLVKCNPQVNGTYLVQDTGYNTGDANQTWFRISVVKSGDSMVFSIDKDRDGTIEATSNSISIADYGTGINAGRLFFGTDDDSIQFDKMAVTVVPEPMTIVTMILGGLLLRRRS